MQKSNSPKVEDMSEENFSFQLFDAVGILNLLKECKYFLLTLLKGCFLYLKAFIVTHD